MAAQPKNIFDAEKSSDEPGLSSKIAEAQAAVAELAAQFTTFVQDDIVAIETALEKARANEGRRMDRIREIFEIAHNLKGQGASFGYDLITEVAHLLCARTRDVGHVDNEALASIAFHVRALRIIVDGKIAGKGGEKGSSLLSKLSSLPGATIDTGT